MSRFVIYDLETTGLDPRFSQIIQVAALLTDERLKVLDEINLRCRLLPHVVPDPAALLAICTGPREIASAPFSHPQMIRFLIEKLREWGPSHFVGHNSIRFDEPFLRHAFYSTLHPPYFTQYDGNRRGDSLKLAQAVYRLAPHALTVPVEDDGRPCFKLARLAEANGYGGYRAHDALADAYAVRFLCALIRERAPAVWSYWLRLADKRRVETTMLLNPVFVELTPSGTPPAIPFAGFWRNLAIPTEVLAFDLRHDPAVWLRNPARLSNGYSGEGGEERVVRRLYTNALPLVLSTGDAADLGLVSKEDCVLWHRRSESLRALPRERVAIAHAMQDERPDRVSEPHVEAQLYRNLPLASDLAHMEEFHRSAPVQRLALLAALVDQRFRTLGRRLLALEHPALFPAAFHARCLAAIAGRLLTDAPQPWLTLPVARARLAALAAEAPVAAQTLLDDCRQEFDRLEARLRPHLPALPEAADLPNGGGAVSPGLLPRAGKRVEGSRTRDPSLHPPARENRTRVASPPNSPDRRPAFIFRRVAAEVRPADTRQPLWGFRS